MGKKIDRLTECQVLAFRKLYPNIVSYYQLSDDDIMRLYRCTTFYYLWLADILMNSLETFCPSKYHKFLEEFIREFLLHGEVLPF